MTDRVRVAFFLSGSGTTLDNLLALVAAGQVPAEVVVVLADRQGTKGIEKAKARGIPTVVVDRRGWRDQAAFDAAVAEAIRPHAADLVVMGGFLRLWHVPPEWRGRVLNVHPSLLPSFGGKGFYGERVHRAVIDAGVRVTGCTVHFVDDEYDHGPIVAQAAVLVEDRDTPDTLAHRVQEAERRIYPACIRLFAEKRLRIEGQRVKVLPPPPAPAGKGADRGFDG